MLRNTASLHTGISTLMVLTTLKGFVNWIFFFLIFLELEEALAFYSGSYFVQRNKMSHVGPITVAMITMVLIMVLI